MSHTQAYQLVAVAGVAVMAEIVGTIVLLIHKAFIHIQTENRQPRA
jgi:energy-converting hydrogenase Eha subunit C